MPLKLPNIAAIGCANFTACARFPLRDRKLLAWFKKNEKPAWERVARVAINRTTHYVRLGISEYHFHFEMARPEFFQTQPIITTSFPEIRSLAEKLMGQQAELDFEAGYFVKTELPDIIRSTMIEITSGGVSLRMSGGTFSVKGGPIYRISWSAQPDKKPYVLLEARAMAKISDTYVEDGLGLVHAAFKELILGGNSHAPRKRQD